MDNSEKIIELLTEMRDIQKAEFEQTAKNRTKNQLILLSMFIIWLAYFLIMPLFF